MTGIGLLLLIGWIRSYYRRKWEGKYPGDPLDLPWIRKRIDCSQIERNGQIISCHYERPRRALVFLVGNAETLEWHFCRFNRQTGWVMD